MLLKKYKLGARLEIIKEGDRNIISRLVDYKRVYDDEYEFSICSLCPFNNNECEVNDDINCDIYDTRNYSYIVVEECVKKAR